MSKWINIESGERPNDDDTVLAINNKFPHYLPEYVCWCDEDQEFMPISSNSRLPCKITHWMRIPKKPE